MADTLVTMCMGRDSYLRASIFSQRKKPYVREWGRGEHVGFM